MSMAAAGSSASSGFARGVVLAGAALSIAACSKDDARGKSDNGFVPSVVTAPGPSSAPSNVVPSARPVPTTMIAPRAPLADCRAIAVTGNATVRLDADAGSLALGSDGELPDGKWIELTPALAQGSASMTVKDPRTARETTYQGIVTARPCVAHTEESWLARGTLESSTNTGEAPGSEEWVVTPAGVVRYTGTVKTSIRVGASTVTVQVVGGIAHASFAGKGSVTPGSDAGVPSVPRMVGDWTDIAAGTTLEARFPLDLAGAADASDKCASAASHARDLATQIAALQDRSTLGALAAEHLAAVVVAHAKCATASLRVAVLQDGAPKRELAAKLGQADRAWRDASGGAPPSVPASPSGAPR